MVWTTEESGKTIAYPDTLVGTDSHTTMINGLSVLGWGVGGIEAEAAMLGQPISMVLPEVVGFRVHGAMKEGATATDLVLTAVQMLRKRGVVGRFVEFYGPGIANMALADRATIGNMAPEYGATCGFFPIDAETIRYLKLTGRDPERIALVEAYAKAQGLWHDENSPEPIFTDTLELDLSTVEPSLAGPRRPQDRVALAGVAKNFAGRSAEARAQPQEHEGRGGGQRRELRAEGRRGRDRRDHLLHQHLQSQRHARRRLAGTQRRETRPQGEALGQDLARAGQPGGHRLLRRRRLAGRSRQAGLQPRRLWLHDLYRQFGAAARSDRGCDR